LAADFRIKSEGKNIERAEKFMFQQLAHLQLDKSMLFDLRLCLDEALANAIKHGNKNNAKRIISISVDTTPQQIELSVADEGDGFQFDAIPDPTRNDNLKKPSGRGIYLMRNLMDEVEFIKNGSKIILRKNIPQHVSRDKGGSMQVKERKEKDVMVCAIAGEITMNNSPELRKMFDTCIEHQEKKIVINLSGVNYIDSSGLATLIEMLQRLTKYQGRLRLCAMTEKIKSIFEITKLEKLFEIFSQEEDAIRGF